MRVDGIQFNLLCEQNVTNVWRKRCFNNLCGGYSSIDSAKPSKELVLALKVFRERIDFDIANTILDTFKYSEKIRNIINAHRYLNLTFIVQI
jgi:hypothetical protein